MRGFVSYRAALAAASSLMMASAAHAAVAQWWAPYTPDANTIGLWHFDDVTGSTGPFADSSGNGNTGTLNSNAGGGGFPLTIPVASGAGTGPGAGLFGTALQYDQTKNAQVAAQGGDTQTSFAWGSVPNNSGQLNFGNAMTIEMWIKPTADDLARSETYFAGIMNGAGGWNFGLAAGTMFLDTLSGSHGYHYTQQSSVTLVADTWAHVAGVLTNDGTTTTDSIYQDGVLVATSSWAATSLVPAGIELEIGINGAKPKYVMFRSNIDEVRLSNVAREFGPAPVPEPASIALMGLAACGLVARRRRA